MSGNYGQRTGGSSPPKPPTKPKGSKSIPVKDYAAALSDRKGMQD